MNNTILMKIETLVNRGLALDQDSLEALELLSGKVIALELINTGLKFYLFPSDTGLQLHDHHDGEVNVTIMATVPDMLSYLMSSREESQSSSGTLQVIGDVGLAQRFQAILRNTDLDWEEFLSRYTGDIFAHKLGNVLREAGRFARNTGDTLRQNVSEYLLYEKEILPVREDLEEYVASVDELRNDVERLKLRVDRLQRTIT